VAVVDIERRLKNLKLENYFCVFGIDLSITYLHSYSNRQSSNS
jgi:hypothetical protein